jgi:hypothetical protein
MPTLVDDGKDKNHLFIYLVIDLKRELIHPYFADIRLDNRGYKGVESDPLELIAGSCDKLFAQPASLFVVVLLYPSEIELDPWIETDGLQSSSANNSSKEIGLVFTSL